LQQLDQGQRAAQVSRNLAIASKTVGVIAAGTRKRTSSMPV
jgi:hypothetical protein